MTQQAENAKGFSDVDAYDDPTPMFTSMDETGRWPAVIELRRWERGHLDLRSGTALLDVGCGLGDVTIALGAAAMPGGRVVGVDSSDQMLEEARRRAAAAGVSATFGVGDATSLGYADASFDVVRSERTLQWLDAPQRAVTEMVRVARPGGLVCIVDTDWRTFVADIAEPELTDRFLTALNTFRPGTPAAGAMLTNWLRDAGARDVEATAQTHLWTEWDPQRSPQPSGFIPISTIVSMLVDRGALQAEEGQRFVAQVEEAGRRGRFFMSVTMFGATGTVG